MNASMAANLNLNKSRIAATTSVTFYLCLSVYLVALWKTLEVEHEGGFQSTSKFLDVRHALCVKLKRLYYGSALGFIKENPPGLFSSSFC